MKDFCADHRKLTFRCSTCEKTARATEVSSLITTHTPECPAGHGHMKLVRDTPKKPLRERKQRWRAVEKLA